MHSYFQRTLEIKIPILENIGDRNGHLEWDNNIHFSLKEVK